MLDFLGIGAQKAGTTWLYHQLSQHPQVRFPAGKEVHFWDRQYSQNVGGYLAQFENSATDDARNGEITPAYAILERARVEEIRAHLPRLRLIYLIRNPIERAWSSALMALRRAEMEVEEASDQWFIDHFRSQGSLRRGDYAACIHTWTSVYPKDQLLIERFESIQQEPLALLERVAAHIGVDPMYFHALPDAELRRRVFAGSGEPLRVSLLPLLENLYRDKVDAVSTYLGTHLDWI